jgi:hypothetical protein
MSKHDDHVVLTVRIPIEFPYFRDSLQTDEEWNEFLETLKTPQGRKDAVNSMIEMEDVHMELIIQELEASVEEDKIEVSTYESV